VAAAGGQATLSPDGLFEDRPDVAVVVFGETPYAEFQGDVRHLDYRPEKPLEILKRLKAAGIPTVSVFLTGRPLWTNPEMNASDAFVAAWLPGPEGQRGRRRAGGGSVGAGRLRLHRAVDLLLASHGRRGSTESGSARI
jgi:hypothetical protein